MILCQILIIVCFKMTLLVISLSMNQPLEAHLWKCSVSAGGAITPIDIPTIPHLDLISSVQSRSGSIVRSMSLRDTNWEEFTAIDRSPVTGTCGEHTNRSLCTLVHARHACTTYATLFTFTPTTRRHERTEPAT